MASRHKVIYSDKANKQLGKLDAYQRKIIIAWISKNLVGTSNPRQHGKPLEENLTGLWRYRVGDYRLIAEIVDDEVVITIIKIGHRSKIYSQL
ncbi:MAG: type II toxin-antitoxin system RelE/ParE family toxin [Clostridiales Family XIII bacterium]|jgi:mRNA interferase RelE/StbE|nr:type II toxin-antitoxin system RelE/ParE family toxin [Clostridiales Family XIII bacterium]